MTTRQSRASLAPSIQYADDIRSRTVVLKMDVNGKPYDRLQMAEALENIIDLKDVQCFGPLNRNAEWYLTLHSEDTKQTLLSLAEITVTTVNGRYRGTITPAGTKEVKARIHWIPPWVSDECVVKALRQHGLDVVSINTDRSTVKTRSGASLTHSFIPVRTVVVKSEGGAAVPHTMRVVDDHFHESYQALITVLGRPPVCLRCRDVGHYRSECTAPTCSKCRKIGHTAELCTSGGRRQYAAVVGGGGDQPGAESDMDNQAVDMLEKSGDSESGDSESDEEEETEPKRLEGEAESSAERTEVTVEETGVKKVQSVAEETGEQSVDVVPETQCVTDASAPSPVLQQKSVAQAQVHQPAGHAAQSTQEEEDGGPSLIPDTPRTQDEAMLQDYAGPSSLPWGDSWPDSSHLIHDMDDDVNSPAWTKVRHSRSRSRVRHSTSLSPSARKKFRKSLVNKSITK